MERPYIPFLTLLVLLLLTIPFSFGFGTWYIPGWQMTNYSSYFMMGFTAVSVLLFITLGYWLLSVRVDKIIWALFLCHLVLTIPTLIFLKFPYIFLDPKTTGLDEMLRTLSFRVKFIPAAWTLFFAGQVLFLIYYIRISRARLTTV